MPASATEVIARHPVIPLALKAAAAASLARLVVLPLGGVADDYGYYAPLGAVIAVSTSLTQSVRSSFHAALAILLGAAVAVTAQQVELPRIVALGLVVGVGTVIGAWRYVGPMASWVPISALFILALGGEDPWHYVVGYLGLTSLGALVGVVVNAIAPPMPFLSAHVAEQSLREALADQLDGLAEGLEQDPLPTRGEWTTRRSAIDAKTRHVQDMVSHVADARRGNWRARRRKDFVGRARLEGRALLHLAFLVEDMVDLLADQEHAERGRVALGPRLRPPAANALRATAAALRSVEGSVAEEDKVDRADAACDELASAIRSMRGETDDEMFEAGTLVTAIRRVLSSVDARDDSAVVHLE